MYIKYFNSDAFDLLKQLPNASVDLILTDPPYQISQPTDGMPGGSWGSPGDKNYTKRPELDFGEWDKVDLDLNTLMMEYYRVLKPRGTLICFYDIWKMQSLKEAAASAKFDKFRMCHWQKTNPVPVNSSVTYLSNSREYFISCIKGNSPTFNSKYDTGVYEYPILHGAERLDHPTQKPVALLYKLIDKHSNKGDVVLDTFAGVASVPYTCMLLNRSCISCELLPKYYTQGVSRLKNNKCNKLTNQFELQFTE